jgi:tripartite-type tricarboxylate transporter receptor subunit TctC
MIGLTAAGTRGEDIVNLGRRQLLFMTAGAAAASALPRAARALDYPTRPVHILVGLPPGGQIDIVARLIGQWLSDRLGQTFIVENRPGAGGNIATEAVVRAPADGYTLLMCTTANAVNASLYQNLNYTFVRDIAPVGATNRIASLLEVHPLFPQKTVVGLIAYAKANPGMLDIATPPIGTGPHMAAELFKMMTGVDVLIVPYRGDSPMLADLLGGQVQVAFGGISASITQVRAGRLVALAVTTAARSEALPDSRRSAIACPATPPAAGRELPHQAALRPKSSISSTRPSMMLSPIRS